MDTGADAQDTRVRARKPKQSKKKKKPTKKCRKQLDSDDDSEDENHHPSITQNIRKAKTFQRLDSNRVEMGKTKSKNCSGPPPKAKKRRQEDKESNYEDSDNEEEDDDCLRLLVKPTQQYVKNNPKDKNEMKCVIRDKFKELVYPHYKFMTNDPGMLQLAGMTFDMMEFNGQDEWNAK